MKFLIIFFAIFALVQCKTYSEFKDCVTDCSVLCKGTECLGSQESDFVICYSKEKECEDYNTDYFSGELSSQMNVQIFRSCFDKCQPKDKTTKFFKMYSCWRECALGNENK